MSHLALLKNIFHNLALKPNPRIDLLKVIIATLNEDARFTCSLSWLERDASLSFPAWASLPLVFISFIIEFPAAYWVFFSSKFMSSNVVFGLLWFSLWLFRLLSFLLLIASSFNLSSYLLMLCLAHFDSGFDYFVYWPSCCLLGRLSIHVHSSWCCLYLAFIPRFDYRFLLIPFLFCNYFCLSFSHIFSFDILSSDIVFDLRHFLLWRMYILILLFNRDFSLFFYIAVHFVSLPHLIRPFSSPFPLKSRLLMMR